MFLQWRFLNGESDEVVSEWRFAANMVCSAIEDKLFTMALLKMAFLQCCFSLSAFLHCQFFLATFYTM